MHLKCISSAGRIFIGMQTEFLDSRLQAIKVPIAIFHGILLISGFCEKIYSPYRGDVD